MRLAYDVELDDMTCVMILLRGKLERLVHYEATKHCGEFTNACSPVGGAEKIGRSETMNSAIGNNVAAVRSPNSELRSPSAPLTTGDQY